MSLREQVQALLRAGDRSGLEALVATESRALKHLVRATYRDEPATRALAVELLGLASEHHPRQIRELVERLLTALDQGSGTNAATVPAVLQAIADRCPRLLVGALPQIIEATRDPGLQPGLAGVLRTVARACPGEVSGRMGELIQLRSGGRDADERSGGSCCG